MLLRVQLPFSLLGVCCVRPCRLTDSRNLTRTNYSISWFLCLPSPVPARSRCQGVKKEDKPKEVVTKKKVS